MITVQSSSMIHFRRFPTRGLICQWAVSSTKPTILETFKGEKVLISHIIPTSQSDKIDSIVEGTRPRTKSQGSGFNPQPCRQFLKKNQQGTSGQGYSNKGGLPLAILQRIIISLSYSWPRWKALFTCVCVLLLLPSSSSPPSPDHPKSVPNYFNGCDHDICFNDNWLTRTWQRHSVARAFLLSTRQKIIEILNSVFPQKQKSFFGLQKKMLIISVYSLSAFQSALNSECVRKFCWFSTTSSPHPTPKIYLLCSVIQVLGLTGCLTAHSFTNSEEGFFSENFILIQQKGPSDVESGKESSRSKVEVSPK